MIYRRCSCRDERGKPYGNLPENATEQQIARACPRLLSDPKHGKWGYYLSRGFGFDPKTKKMKRLQTRVANFSSKRAAQSAYAKAKTEHDAGQFRETNRTPFAQWCNEWLETSGLSTGLVAAYRRYFDNDVAPSALGRMRLSDIRRADVQRFVDGMLAAGRGLPTVRKAHRGISSAFTAAVRGDLIAANPAHGVVFPKERRPKFEPWSPAQAGLFLDHAAKHRLGVVLEVAMFTGLRPAELAGLRWIDIDLASRTLTVRWTRTIVDGKVEEKEPKTEESQASIDLEDQTVGALVAWQITQQHERERFGALWQNSGYVFTHEDGRPLRRDYVLKNVFKPVWAATNATIAAENDKRVARGEQPEPLLSWIKMHGLRHMHASLMLASGADIALTSKRLRHSSVVITSDVYTHLIGDRARHAAEAVAALVPRATAHPVHNDDGQIAPVDAGGVGTLA
ncbi:site-specific integrase [Microbacterium luticocti]|uniref:site-specific integrase n=1 Tax=Microbacterium luticocti TaxID=451764 RepID=UPI000401425D|nr:site-specific integrase [Microbacterium luticocti]